VNLKHNIWSDPKVYVTVWIQADGFVASKLTG
jgi:hypothetical protein